MAHSPGPPGGMVDSCTCRHELSRAVGHSRVPSVLLLHFTKNQVLPRSVTANLSFSRKHRRTRTYIHKYNIHIHANTRTHKRVHTGRSLPGLQPCPDNPSPCLRPASIQSKPSMGFVPQGQQLDEQLKLLYAQVTRNSAMDLKTLLFVASNFRTDPAKVKEVYNRSYSGLQKGLTRAQFMGVMRQALGRAEVGPRPPLACGAGDAGPDRA